MGVDINAGLDMIQPREWVETGFKYAKMAVWAKDPINQVAANLVIIVVAMISSTVSLGATLVIAVISFPFLVLGLLRLFWSIIQGRRGDA